MEYIKYLQKAIKGFDKENVLTEEQTVRMSESLAHFTFAAITKFIAGQKDHGGDLRDRNLMHELAQEQIDSFWYGPFGAMSWPDKDKEEPRHD